jgi:hypothetical protein
MSLLANVNQPNDKGYYFAFDTTPGTAVVDAQAFVATGGAEVGIAGFVSVRGDAVPGGLGMFNITRPSGTPTWSMGLDGTPPSGTSTGNDLTFYAYDNSGGFLGAPLLINRATGNVAMTGDLVVGTGTDASGGFIEVNGASGVSRVNDPVYNPVVTYGAEVLLGSASRLGVISGTPSYTAPKTGVYCLTVSVNVDANGLVWTNGATGVIGYASFSGGGGTASNSYLACDAIMVPNGTVPGFGPNTYIKDMVAFIELDANDVIVPSIYTQGAMDLGVTGAVTYYIQPVSVA